MKKLRIAFFAALAILLWCPLIASPALAAKTRILIPWFTGADAGYTSLLSIENASIEPWSAGAGVSGACTLDAYYNGTHFGPGSLGVIAPGNVSVFTVTQVETATGLSLANSGQRAQLFLTCDFPDAQAMLLFVNLGGVVTFLPGTIIVLPTK